MNFLKVAALGAISTLVIGCTEHESITVGGAPGVFFRKPGATPNKHVVSRFDPNHIETPRTRGQLKFGMPIERNFKPTPKREVPLPERPNSVDSVPDAIENFRRHR